MWLGWKSLPLGILEGPFLSHDNAALEKCQVLPAVTNDYDDDDDDDDDNYADEYLGYHKISQK